MSHATPAKTAVKFDASYGVPFLRQTIGGPSRDERDDARLYQRRWPEVVAEIKEPLLKEALEPAAIVGVIAYSLFIAFPEDAAFFRGTAEKYRDELERAITAVLGRPLGARLILDDYTVGKEEAYEALRDAAGILCAYGLRDEAFAMIEAHGLKDIVL